MENRSLRFDQAGKPANGAGVPSARKNGNWICSAFNGTAS
jgi:hypothetical protein